MEPFNRLWRSALWLAVLSLVPVAHADDPTFSGPQVGEKLPGFQVRGVFDAEAGKPLNFVERAGEKPLVLIFIHEVNRQSISLVRLLTKYTVSRAPDGLVTGSVLLDDDVSAAENTLKRIRHALTPGAPTGVSLDGREGPGSYGLNRNVTLTILVGKAGRVTANFALVQPSLQADLPKILDQVVAVAGGRAPQLAELETPPADARQPANAAAPDMRSLLAPVIRRDAEPEQVDAAARQVEQAAESQAAVRRELSRITTTIIRSGKLADYGTPRAQEYLGKWARRYTPPADEPPPLAQANDYSGPMKSVARKFHGKAGVVLHIGDSITYANPYGQWPRQGDGRTEADRDLLAWMHAGRNDETDGWWLASFDHPSGGRSHTACSGIRLDEMLKGGRQGLPSLADMLDRYQPQLVVLLLGSNDVSAGRSVADFARDLDRAVGLALDRGIVCIVSTLPPHIQQPRLAADYSQAVRALAERRALPLIDYEREILTRRPDDWNGTLLNRDDLHPSATVGAVLATSPPTVDNLRSSGYLLRGWLSLRKIAEVKQRVLDNP